MRGCVEGERGWAGGCKNGQRQWVKALGQWWVETRIVVCLQRWLVAGWLVAGWLGVQHLPHAPQISLLTSVHPPTSYTYSSSGMAPSGGGAPSGGDGPQRRAVWHLLDIPPPLQHLLNPAPIIHTPAHLPG
eukprot:360794-Chlamydomonas_euryale.AAC.12